MPPHRRQEQNNLRPTVCGERIWTTFPQTYESVARSQMPRNFYVSMFDRRSNIPMDGMFYRLVGPFTTLDEATPHRCA